jgi:bidirectional [NiFe] hydrogenase diaphorase subunit
VSSNTRSGGGMPSGDPPPGAPPTSQRARSNAPGGTRGAVPKESGDHPSGDNRFKMLDASMKRHRHAQDALIEVLHTAQELFGYLRTDLLQFIAHGLKLPPSRVYGVATFYHSFSFAPKGRHTCVVCTGTACYVKGADALLEAVEHEWGTPAGKTTADGQVTIMTARCLGACGLAPVAVYDGEVAGAQAPASALDRMKGWRDDGPR